MRGTQFTGKQIIGVSCDAEAWARAGRPRPAPRRGPAGPVSVKDTVLDPELNALRELRSLKNKSSRLTRLAAISPCCDGGSLRR